MELVIEHGPDHAGTAAKFWPNGDYPPAVAEALKATIRCPEVGEYAETGEPEMLTILPGRGLQGGTR